MKLSDKKQIKQQSFIVHQLFFASYILIFLLMAVASTTLSSQVNRKLPARAYEHVVKPNIPVEIKTIENGKVTETHTSSLKDLQIGEGSKKVATYEKDISIINAETYAKIISNPEAKGEREDFKILPELHFEKRGSVIEVFRIAFTLTKPFEYSFDQNNFSTTMKFFLLPEIGNSTATLMEPIYLEVVSNVVDTFKPENLKLPYINLPSTKVELIADRVSDSAEVRVITATKPGGYPTYLKVEPALEIFTNRSSLQGYGIQTIPVEVRFIGSSSSDSVKVNFNVSKGSVSPGSMYVSYNKPSTIYLRSEGTGDAILSAAATNSNSNKISFNYTFPWSFLLFSIVGGLIGGLAKHYFTSDKKKFPVKPIIGGILIGFIVAIAYYFLGINLIGLSLSAEANEMAVLGISALGAYFGINVSPKPKD